MKKLLLVLAPAVLLLTSCLGDGDDQPVDPVEVNFYNTFIVMQNHGHSLINIVDEFMDMYQEDELPQGVTVNDNGDGTFSLVANFNNLNNNDDYQYYRGELKARIEMSGASIEDGVSIVIDVNDLTFQDSYGTYSYEGKLTAIDIFTGDLDVRMQDITFVNLSLTSTSTSELLWQVQYSYSLIQDGISTPNDSSDDIYTWSDGLASGKHNYFGTFSANIQTKIVKKAALRFISSGKYVFIVQNIGNGILPFYAEYGVPNDGLITITTTDGYIHSYPQQGTAY
ncbi:MAG: hypothetical protein LBG19_12300 [Prevotellaceae bacterium]|jgi:hypothetical protein|nr:hypothetical protein [Prevotellaceae bacterium]